MTSTVFSKAVSLSRLGQVRSRSLNIVFYGFGYRLRPIYLSPCGSKLKSAPILGTFFYYYNNLFLPFRMNPTGLLHKWKNKSKTPGCDVMRIILLRLMTRTELY